MSIREKLSKVKDLQTKMLQDFLKLVLHENNFSKTEWQNHFVSFVKKQKESKRNQTAEIFKTIMLNGIDSIEIEQLDTTAIINYLQYGGLPYKDKKIIEKCLSLLQDDRNFESHTKGNESSRELYQYTVSVLSHLMDLVGMVWDVKREKNLEGEKYEFSKRYRKIINDTLIELDDEYRKEIIENNRKLSTKIRKNGVFYGFALILLGMALMIWYIAKKLDI